MKFNKFYFENYPIDTPFDENNPRYVMALEGVDEIIENVIKNEPYTLSVDEFENRELTNALLHIDVLKQKGNKLAMAVPFFVEQDAAILKELSKKVASSIANELIKNAGQLQKIIAKIENGYSADRNLYHLLCGYIFDGLMFEYLEEQQFITTSRVHKSGLDYLVILYQDADVLNEYSDMLLCSYNRLIVNGKGFVSFGDSNGKRKDFYRYMRLKELNQLNEQESKLMSYPKEGVIEKFVELVDGKEIDEEYLEIYEFFEYYKNGQITVPIYDEKAYKVADELYKCVLDITKTQIGDALSVIQDENRLLANLHGVEIKDIANEMYHLIFGEVNELLAQSGIVSNPVNLAGEGRYFKCFER
ncbi:MAG: hypothetical protein IJZ23_00320 [Roseburia sp.]|nr:hypothetical protein [Roseburia sp.]